jgi:hypothetical protein
MPVSTGLDTKHTIFFTKLKKPSLNKEKLQLFSQVAIDMIY